MKAVSRRSEDMGSTIFSVIAGIVDVEDHVRQAQLGRFIQQYGEPLKAHIVCRSGVDSATAEDLLHDFLIEKLIDSSSGKNLAGQFLEKKESHGVSFRGYLLRSLNNYLIDKKRVKRHSPVSLDHERDSPLSMEVLEANDRFDVDWAENLLQQAVHAVRKECEDSGQEKIWKVFEMRVLLPAKTGEKPPDYEELITQIGFATAKEASNRLRTSIRKFNRILRELIREYLPETDLDRLNNAVSEELDDLRKVLRSARELTIEKIDSLSENSNSSLANSVSLLCLESSSELLWNNENGMNQLWGHVLSTPLSLLIEEWKLNVSLEQTANETHSLQTLRELWQHPCPPLELLQALKTSAKRSAMNIPGQEKTHNNLPYGINVILYTTMIAIAELRLNTRTTSDSNSRIAPRLKAILKTPWLDAMTREILSDWKERVTASLQAECPEMEYA